MNPTDKATYENANSSEINDVYSDDQVTVDKKIHARARGIKHDKKKKITRKKRERFEKQCKQYDDVLGDHMLKEFAKTKSPHVIISNKTFNNMKFNVIMLSKPSIDNTSNNRNIFYEIKWMGKNVLKTNKGKFCHPNPASTKRNIIFVVVAMHEMIHIDNLIFYTEKGEMIPGLSVNTNRHGYVLLAFIKLDKSWKNQNILMTENRSQIANKFYINQIKQKQGNYHFGTSGIIYGLGYGPKCHRNEHGHSVDRYSNSKSAF